MKLTIFSRMVISFLAIFILSMAMSVHSILQLHRLEDITKSILRFDNRLIDLEQKLSDGLLSMMRYEKKYIINKDEELYDLFSLAKGGFDKHFEEIMSVADSARTRDLLGRVNLNYQNYQSSFDEEVRYLKSGEDYPRDSYEKERGQAVNSIMKDLRKLRMHSQINTSDKIKQLGAAEGEAIRLAIGMTIISFIFIVAISIVITINITKPLSVMKKKTREIAKGEFGGDLKLSSSPEIKELAHALNSMCAKLKEIDKMKSDFFSLMSHELRTPLTSIREGTNLLMESFKAEEITKDQKKLLVIMTEESNRLIKLVNSLLDLSKMEAGMMVYNFTRADLIPLINRVTREIEPLAETKNIKIEVQAGKELPLIKIDGEGMLKVLRNLIGNAVKFTPDSGYVRVLAQTIEQGVKVSVEDTGSGISKESLTSIFDKFQQGILTHSNKIKGTGLGLFIAKQIINAHGGRIWAESTVGQGSTFAFVLPA